MPAVRCKKEGCRKEWPDLQTWRDEGGCSCKIEARNVIQTSTDEVNSYYPKRAKCLFVETPPVLCSHITPHNVKVGDGEIRKS